MNTRIDFKKPLLAAALAVIGLTAQAATLTRADFTAGKTRISDEYKADKALCDAMKANAKDVCVEQAKAKEKVARADLVFGYTGTQADATKARVAKADGLYAVAKEQCDDLAGNPKDVCVKEAKAVHVKAVAEAKLVKTVSDASSSATDDVRKAEYKVAAEKCDALAGDAKSSCVTAAKGKYRQ